MQDYSGTGTGPPGTEKLAIYSLSAWSSKMHEIWDCKFGNIAPI